MCWAGGEKGRVQLRIVWYVAIATTLTWHWATTLRAMCQDGRLSEWKRKSSHCSPAGLVIDTLPTNRRVGKKRRYFVPFNNFLVCSSRGSPDGRNRISVHRHGTLTVVSSSSFPPISNDPSSLFKMLNSLQQESNPPTLHKWNKSVERQGTPPLWCSNTWGA